LPADRWTDLVDGSRFTQSVKIRLTRNIAVDALF
jgi:hypothetical protein